MPTENENYLLLWSIIQQKLNDAGQLENINWAAVAENLGLDKSGTASVRWVRLKDEFSKLGFPGLPDKSNGNNIFGKAGAVARKKEKDSKVNKATNSKARSAVVKKPRVGKAGGKSNGKVNKHEEDEGRSNDGGEELKVEMGN